MKETAIHQQVLDCPMGPNDAKAETVRDYLVELLARLWIEEEGFSAKRPFGNSGWAYEVYTPLVAAGLIDGTLDEHGYVDEIDLGAADDLIAAAIRTLGNGRSDDVR